jgi:hypothetical protein
MAFITIDRKIFKHFLWTERRPRTRFEAWIDLIQMASFDDNNELLMNGTLVKWGRGEYPISYSFLADRWVWSIQKVRGYVIMLKNNRQVVTKTTGQTTVLTLCNYDEYNPKQQGRRQAKSTTTNTIDDKVMAGIKEDKEYKQLNKYRNIPPTLEEIKIRMEERQITSFTPDGFFSHYTANGWLVGKNKMKNWDAALTYWNNNKNFNVNGNNRNDNQRSVKRINQEWDNQA